MDYEYQLQSPIKAVERVLREFGGWSRIFATSQITWDKKNITYSQKEVGFWFEWAKVRSYEYLEEEVEICYKEIVAMNGKPKDKEDKEDLKKRVRKALLNNGWKPPKTKIIREARAMRKEYREQIASLKTLKEKRNEKYKKGKERKESFWGKCDNGKWSYEQE